MMRAWLAALLPVAACAGGGVTAAQLAGTWHCSAQSAGWRTELQMVLHRDGRLDSELHLTSAKMRLQERFEGRWRVSGGRLLSRESTLPRMDGNGRVEAGRLVADGRLVRDITAFDGQNLTLREHGSDAVFSCRR